MAKSSPVLKAGFHRDRFPVGEERETKLGEIDKRARKLFPHYFKLPEADPIRLLYWRRYVRHRCATDYDFRDKINEICKQDFLFACTTFFWIHEPRPVPRRLPFFPYKDQSSLAAWFEEIYGTRSGIVNKTRGIGLTWLALSFIYWKWLYHPGTKIAVLTKDEELLESADSNSSLGKLQFLHDNMPSWMHYTKTGEPKLYRTRDNHFFQNKENDSLVQGFVSKGDKLRQLRFTFLFADEFAFYQKCDQEEWMASAGGTCPSLLLVSTWGSRLDLFHQIFYEEESSILKMSAYWWNNEERWQGAYKMRGGLPVLVDKEYDHPPDYEFGVPELIEEGMLRSPWVDNELLAPGAGRTETLRDLYGMQVTAKENSFFDANVQAATRQTKMEPDLQGKLHLTRDGLEIQPTTKSEIRLWKGVPERDMGPYTCFCDLGGGAGQAYSVACFLDKSGEQVCEYGVNDVDITAFATRVVAICRWLARDHGDGWAVLDAEAAGPLIKPFTAEAVRLNYANIWQNRYAVPKMELTVTGEIPTYLGTSNKDGGLTNFREFSRAIMAMDCIVRSEHVVDDLARCGRDHEKGGRPVFPPARYGRGHGDFAYAAAGAWWRVREVAEQDERHMDDTEKAMLSRPEEAPKNKNWSDEYRGIK